MSSFEYPLVLSCNMLRDSTRQGIPTCRNAPGTGGEALFAEGKRDMFIRNPTTMGITDPMVLIREVHDYGYDDEPLVMLSFPDGCVISCTADMWLEGGGVDTLLDGMEVIEWGLGDSPNGTRPCLMANLRATKGEVPEADAMREALGCTCVIDMPDARRHG